MLTNRERWSYRVLNIALIVATCVFFAFADADSLWLRGIAVGVSVTTMIVYWVCAMLFRERLKRARLAIAFLPIAIVIFLSSAYHSAEDRRELEKRTLESEISAKLRDEQRLLRLKHNSCCCQPTSSTNN